MSLRHPSNIGVKNGKTYDIAVSGDAQPEDIHGMQEEGKLSERRLRVLIYSDHFFPSVGGSENYAFDLASELSRCGHYVGVITSERKSVKDDFPFTIFRLERPFSLYRINLNVLDIPRIIKSYRPELFHINYQTGGENILILLLKIMRIPIVITYHADHVMTLGKVIDELQLVTTYRFAENIVVQSALIKNKFRMRGISERKLNMIQFNGVDTNKYKYVHRPILNKKSLKLLCIARLDDSHKYKGVFELIESINGMKRKKLDLDLFLNIIGDGNLRKSYENKCRSNHLNNINFLGDLSFEDLLRQIYEASFLILPSISEAEGFGRVVLEAISCGTPVIVSKYAGIAELIRKYDAGIVYDPENFEKMIIDINDVLNNHEKIQQFIENGKKLISEEQLTLYETTRKVIDVYYKSIGIT